MTYGLDVPMSKNLFRTAKIEMKELKFCSKKTPW